jgi:hypothetical protein
MVKLTSVGATGPQSYTTRLLIISFRQIATSFNVLRGASWDTPVSVRLSVTFFRCYDTTKFAEINAVPLETLFIQLIADLRDPFE